MLFNNLISPEKAKKMKKLIKNIFVLVASLLLIVEFTVIQNLDSNHNWSDFYKTIVSLVIIILISIEITNKKPWEFLGYLSLIEKLQSFVYHLLVSSLFSTIVLIFWATINHVHDGDKVPWHVLNNVLLLGIFVYVSIVIFSILRNKSK